MSASLSLKTLSQACRSLSTLLESGVEVRRAFKLASNKASDARCRDAFEEINIQISAGNEISAAMRGQGRTFPELMIDMIEMSEGTGSLPEVLTHLADHYENNLRLRREFVGSIMWPMFQLVAAVMVIALLIFIFGMIPDGGPNGPNIKQLVFGLSGFGGAVIWLTCTFGSAFLLWIGFQVANRSFAARRVLDPLWLQVPVLSTCLRSFAIARFSWAFYLTQQSGMPMVRSLTASLKATDNGSFQSATPLICAGIREGEDLSVVLAESHLFPEDFLHMVSVGETSGTVPEMLHRLSPQFEDQARRSLKALTATISWTVWLLVAVFIVFFIFRFFMWYVGILNDAVRGAGG